MIYLYILYNSGIDKYYIGQSNDPWRRLIEHNSNNKQTYTGKSSEWTLEAVFEVSPNRGDVDKIEKFIKKQKSRTLILQLVNPEFVPTGQLAQLVRVPHARD